MKAGKAILAGMILCLCLTPIEHTQAQSFKKNNITDSVFFVNNPEGEDQLVIESEKGLVVFNTFWSSIVARRYKDEITRVSGRDDFYLTVNLVDRLDMFGGNSVYEETIIIGHKNILKKYKGKESEVDAEIRRLIDMWRWKEDVSRERLATHAKGSQEEKNERGWMNSCKQRADELEQGFSLVLPKVVYDDRKTMDLGNISLELIWFGRAGFDGMSVAVVPEEKLAIIPGFILHSGHLAPHPNSRYAKLDVPRWIEVLEELLEDDSAIESFVCDINQVWTKERVNTHLVYIKRLWDSVKKAEAAGKSQEEVQVQLSLDNEFSFVKKMQPYKDGGDDWIRPQHMSHVRVFYLQHKNLASEILRKEKKGSLQKALARVRKQRASDGDIYFDESSINSLGYELMNSSRLSDAIEVFKLNVEVFPESANVYDSLAEAYMKSDDIGNAIKYYEKSLELNPENENAREMLNTISPSHQ
jgi:tetratricopeptide (TPR) repeat protein